MKLLVLTSTLLLVGSAFAAPGTALRRARNQKRAAGRRASLINRLDSPEVVTGNISNVDYSSNWAGAILVGTGYTSVTGRFTVPTPSSSGSGSAWVGIDGDTCETAILQTGIDWTKSGSSITYDAWYEWYPDYAYDFSGISMSAGDEMKVTVTASSKTAGVATIENISTGKTVTHTFSNEGSEGDLCEYNAEWIIEDFEEGSSMVKFADFGTVTFTDCSVTQNGEATGISGAEVIDIKQKSKVLTSCSVPSSSEVTCTYE